MGDSFQPDAGDSFVPDQPALNSLAAARNKLLLGISGQRTQFERERDPANQPGILASIGTSLGAFLPQGQNVGFSGSPLHYSPGLNTGVAEQGALAQQQAIGLADRARAAQGRTLPYRLAAGIGTTIADVPGMEQNADIGNPRGILGNALGSAAPAIIPEMVRGLSAARGAKSAIGAGIEKPLAVEKIVQAMEADPKAQPAMRANLNEALDAIGNHAQQTGQPIRTVGDLAKVTRAAADADPYRQNFIEPFKDVEVTAPGSFKGRIFDYNRTTIGSLDARLSEINNTLYPKYLKGGAGSNAAQAAIGAEGAAALTNEAATIRSVLAKEVGKRAGVDPAIVQEARGRWGQLNDLAEKFQLEVNSRFQEAARKANTPTTVGDVLTAAKKIPVNPKNWRSNISDRMIQSVFENYQPSAPQATPFNPPGAAAPRKPLWEGVTGPTEPQGLFRQPTAAEAAEAQANQRGNLNYRANVNARAKEAALAKIRENLAKHGNR